MLAIQRGQAPEVHGPVRELLSLAPVAVTSLDRHGTRRVTAVG